MKRYFYDLSGNGWEPDLVGTELPNDAAARREAIRFVGEVLKGEPHRLENGSLRVNVHDRQGVVYVTIDVVANTTT